MNPSHIFTLQVAPDVTIEIPKDYQSFQQKFSTEQVAMDYLTTLLYPTGCQIDHDNLYPLTGRRSYRCRRGHSWSPLSTTIFRKSSTPLKDWFYVIYLYAVLGDNLTALTVKRHIKVKLSTAWRMIDVITTAHDPTIKQQRKYYVGIHQQGSRWRARTKVDGETVNLGTFDTVAEARAAYLTAKRLLGTKSRYKQP